MFPDSTPCSALTVDGRTQSNEGNTLAGVVGRPGIPQELFDDVRKATSANQTIEFAAAWPNRSLKVKIAEIYEGGLREASAIVRRLAELQPDCYAQVRADREKRPALAQRPNECDSIEPKAANVKQDIESNRITNETQEKDREPSGLCGRRPASTSGTILDSNAPDDSLEPESEKTNDETAEEKSVNSERDVKRARTAWFKTFKDCRLADFMVKAYEFSREQESQDSTWHSDLFWFVWLLKGHREMEQLSDPKEVTELIQSHLEIWTSVAKKRREEPPNGFIKKDPWGEWLGVTKADARAEIADLWKGIRYKPGHGPLEQAFAEARRYRLILRKDVAAIRPYGDGESRDEDDYEFFISLAGHLQVVNGNQNIKLPVEILAEMLKVSAMTISRYRRWAIEDGYIKEIVKHKFRSNGGGSATEFRFSVSMYESLRKKSRKGTAESFSCAETVRTPKGRDPA